MKKAIIATGGKQYLVAEGETLEVELLKQEGKTASFVPLLVIDGDKTTVGTPEVAKVKVNVEIVEPEVKGDKVLAIRYKAKKRVHKIRGHRQRHTLVTVQSIA
ncbi:MAG TPA: 50S ribosomal protein L21 [Candidatus Limnocylindrales bacterium]|nr:50S ribosomal protein L21 [Candidatus Limnocylindrales bacterium]